MTGDKVEMKLKKIVSLLLTAAVIISMLCIPVVADSSSNSDFTITDGVLTAYTGLGGNVVIPDTVTSIGSNAFLCKTAITSITIPESVVSIGNYAFEGCIGLSAVTIPKGVTSIGIGAFAECLGTAAFTVESGNACFSSLDNNLANKDGTKLIQYAYGKSQKTYTIPSSVTSIGDYAFIEGQNKLTSVTISNSVASIGNYAFAYCWFASVNIPKGVTIIGDYAFAYNTTLTSITIPISVTSIGINALYDTSAIIYGEANSCAQTYAKGNGIVFSETGSDSSSTSMSITVTSAAGTAAVAKGFTLQLASTDSSATWSVDKGTGAAKITTEGLLTGTSAGTVIVTSTDGTVSGSLTVTVTAGAEIDVAVTNDNRSKTAVSGLTCKVYNSSDNDITDYVTVNSTAGVGTYKITGLPQTGDYYITMLDGNDSERIKETINMLGSTAVKVSAYWEDIASAGGSTSKVGVLGGLVVSSGDTAASGVTVKAYNSSGTIWSTVTDSRGAYKFYLVPGSYTVVATAASSSYSNDSATIKVVAGYSYGPLIELTTQAAWGTAVKSANNKLGYTAPTYTVGSKTITGTATAGCIVAVYSYDSTTGTYTLLSRSVTATSAGKYAINLTNALSNGTLVIRITDSALNVYDAQISVSSTRTMKLTASTTATVATTTVVTYADAAASSYASFLTSSITGLTVKNPSGNTVSLTKGTDYNIASGKITFAVDVLGTAGNYTITVKANGYTDCTVTQNIKSSTNAPTAISGFTSAAGSVGGTTRFTSVGTALSGYEFVYKIASTSALEYKDNVYSGFTSSNSVSTLLTKGADISGVGTTNKYVQIYEISSTTGKIYGARLITLSTSQIKAPSISSTVVSGSALTLTADDSLSSSYIPATTAFKVTMGTTADTVKTVAVSGNIVTLTLTTAATSTDKVMVLYTKPFSNSLQDAYGNIVASTSSITANNNTASTSLTTIDIAAIPSIVPPAEGATPKTKTSDTTEFTTAITWSPSVATFAANTVYTATITITPKTGYTLKGVSANYFTLLGAATTNAADSGVVTAAYPVTETTSNTTELEAAILTQSKNRIDYFAIKYTGDSLTLTELCNIVNEAFASDDYINLSYRVHAYSYGGTSGNYTVYIQVTWVETLEEISYVNTTVTQILSKIITNYMTDDEKEFAIHNYITEHVTYDDTQTYVTAYTALHDRKTVCRGYAMLFYKMMTMAGLNAKTVSGYAFNNEKDLHSWNMAEIDGVWYYVDVTWDDSTSSYTYYNVTSTFLASHYHTWDTSSLPTAGTTYVWPTDLAA